MGLKEKFGVDLGVFKDSTTWKALGIGIVLFSIIGYAGLSMFDLASSGYGVDRDNIRLAPATTHSRALEELQNHLEAWLICPSASAFLESANFESTWTSSVARWPIVLDYHFDSHL